MFNAGYKKEALKECEKASKEYNERYEDTIKKTTQLYSSKERAVSILKNVDEYVQSLSNKPEEFQKLASEILVRRKKFEEELNDLKIESKKGDRVSQNIAGAGALAGVGVAAFGPSAAMGIATTFGTASTGTAIASLAGAAQTNAALAWLGGGTLLTGGGGIAGGQAFLALAGPVGWAIGGAALVGGGLMANSKNKKIAAKAERQTKQIKDEDSKLKVISCKVDKEQKAINSLNSGISSTLCILKGLPYRDYKKFSSTDKDNLMQLMNSAEALSKRIGVKIS